MRKKYALLLSMLFCVFMSSNLSADSNVVRIKDKSDGFGPPNDYEYNRSKLKEDKEYLLEAINQTNGNAFEYTSNKFKRDKEVVINAIKQSCTAFRYADSLFKSDKDLVSKFLNKCKHEFEYIDESLKKDKSFTLNMIRFNDVSLCHADKSLREDRDVVIQTVKKNGAVLHCLDNFKKDKEVVFEAIKSNPLSFQYADFSLKEDRDYVGETFFKGYPSILEYSSGSIKEEFGHLTDNEELLQMKRSHESIRDLVRVVDKELTRIFLGLRKADMPKRPSNFFPAGKLSKKSLLEMKQSVNKQRELMETRPPNIYVMKKYEKNALALVKELKK